MAVLIGVVLIVAALYLAQTVLIPVALAIFLSFILSPLVARLERWHLPRVPAVVIVGIFAFAAMASLGWTVGHQAMNMVTRLPEFRENLESRISFVRDKVRGPLQKASEVVHDLERHATREEGASGDPKVGDGKAGETKTGSGKGERSAPPDAKATESKASTAPAAAEPSPILGWATAGFGTLASVLGTAGVVILLVFIMLIQRGDLRDRFIALTGGGVVLTTQALDEAAQRVSRYLLVLTFINASYGTALGVGLWLIGVPNAVLWGIVAGAMRFIPYVGPWVAAALPILFSFAISTSLTTPLLACGLFIALELLTNLVIEPVMLPNHIGVSTTALVVSAVFWAWLWGAPGLFLATPLTVCVVVLGKHIPRMRFLSVMLGDQPVLSPSLRIYQRLLVGDTDDAGTLIAADTKSGESVVEICDSLLVPALCLAQQDRLDRVIDDSTLVTVAERARELADDVLDREKQKVEPVVHSDVFRVVCISAERETDAAASSMLCGLLRRAGFDSIEAPHGALVSEALEVIGSARADAVCISQVPPFSFTRLRYLCKRIQERFPGTAILVGTWTVSLDLTKVQERIQSGNQLHVAGTLAEMVQQVERIAALARSAPPPKPATVAIGK